MRHARPSRVFEVDQRMATVEFSDQTSQYLLQCAMEAHRRVFNLMFLTPVDSILKVGKEVGTYFFDSVKLVLI